MVNVNLDKRAFFIFVLIFALLIVAGFVFAYGGNNPYVLGHPSTEVNVNVKGSDMKLQEAIDNRKIGNEAKTTYLASYSVKVPKGTVPSATQCPADWNRKNITELIGNSPSNTFNMWIGTRSNYLGTSESIWGYEDYIGFNFAKTANGIFDDSANDYWLCWKEFDRKMYVHLVALNDFFPGCPTGYTNFNVADLERKDGRSYFISNEGGFFLGGLSGWWWDSNSATGRGAQDENWAGDTKIARICMKIYESNVYPLTLIMKDKTPFDYTLYDEKNDFFCYNATYLNGIGSQYIDFSLNDNSYFLGGSERDWHFIGDNYMTQNLRKTSMGPADGGQICFKFYNIEKNGNPEFKFRTLTGVGNCWDHYAEDYSEPWSQLGNIDKLATKIDYDNNPSNYVHMHHTPYGAFIGGVNVWGGTGFPGSTVLRDGEYFRYRWYNDTYARLFCWKFG